MSAKEKIAIVIFAILLVCYLLATGFLSYSVFGQGHLNYWPVLRVLYTAGIALLIGLVATVITGKVSATFTFKKAAISATAGFAIMLIILLVWDPFPEELESAGVSTTPEFQGTRLGDFVEILQAAYAENRTSERISFVATDASRLEAFRMSVAKVSAPTWVQVAERICEIHKDCLGCKASDDRKSVEIHFTLEPKECRSSAGDVFYRCSSTSC